MSQENTAPQQTPVSNPPQQNQQENRKREVGKKGKPFDSLRGFAKFDDEEKVKEAGKEEKAGSPESVSAEESPEAGLREGNALAHETPKEINESTPGEKKEKQKFKFTTKIDGVEEEVELTEDDIRRDYQKLKASDKRFQAAAEQDKRARETIEKMSSEDGLLEALVGMGYDPMQLAEKLIYNRLQVEAMSPEQKRIMELEQREHLRQQKDKQQQELIEQERFKEDNDRLTKEIQADIMSVLQSNAIPATAQNTWRVGNKMLAHYKYGIDLSAKDAADLVLKDLQKEYRALTSHLDAEKLLEMIGPEAADKIRKRDLAKVANPFQSNVPKEKQPKPQSKPPKRHYRTEAEWKKHMAKIHAGK
jgi:hypothetical protein